MNKTISTNIIVLKKTAYQESSLIISSISAEYGKIDFVVKGARRIGKKEQPIVDIFRELAVEFKESKSGLNSPISLDLLKEHDKIALRPEIFMDVSRLTLFLLKNIYPHVPCNRIYSTFNNLLEKSVDGSIKTFDFCLFKLVFLFENGFLPEYLEGGSDNTFQHSDQAIKQQMFLSKLISYTEGNASNIPKLSSEYQDKFSDWITNLCRYNDLE